MPITQSATSQPLLGQAGLSGPEVHEQETILHFRSGLPGFEASTTFHLEGLGPRFEPLCRMRSVTEPEVSFVLLPPGVLFPDYSVEIDEDHVRQLDLRGPDDALVLAIVTLPTPPRGPTINLLGPVVVNRRTLTAAQVVQHRSSYGTAVPFPGSPGPSTEG